MSGVPPFAEILVAFEVELQQQLSIPAVGEHTIALGITSVRGPDPSEVTVRTTIAKVVPTASAQADPVMVWPRVRGLTTGFPTSRRETSRMKGDRGGRGDHTALWLGSCRCVVLPTWLWCTRRALGALVSLSGGEAFRRRLQVVSYVDPSQVLLVIDDEEEHALTERFRRAIHRQAASTEEVVVTAMVCPLPYAFPLD
jgi:hypothetical protein